MTNYNLDEVSASNYQLLLSFILILTIIISISLTYNERQKSLNKKTLYNGNQEQNILRINRTIAFFVGVGFVFLNVQARNRKKRAGNVDLKFSNYQVLASIFTLIAYSIVLYIAFNDKKELSVQLENPEL
jgi:magnesium-transporting ATPase (P-type)